MNILEFPKESNPKAFKYVHLVHEDETKFITNPKYKEQYENMKNLPIDSALRVHYSKLDAKGGFHLEFVSTSRVINHMTCYKFSALIELRHSDWRENLSNKGFF